MQKFYLALCWAGIILLTLTMGLVLSRIGYARNLNGQWDNSPNHEWYAKQQLTPAAQVRLGFPSCCSEGDEFPTQFKVVADGTKYGTDRYFYFKDNQWLLIPEDIVKFGETPDGAPHIWLYPYDSSSIPKNTPICFIIPDDKG